MQQLRRVVMAGALLAAALIAPAAATAATPPTTTTPSVHTYQFPLTARTRAAIAASAPTVPTWSRTAFVGSTPYQFKMVGTNPFVAQPNPVTRVKTIIIPLSITFSGTGHVYDPTVADAQCLGGSTAVDRALQSPVFGSHSYSIGGTTIGKGQFVDMFQRASFWKYTKPSGVNPNYHVVLVPTVTAPIQLTVTGTEVDSPCGRLGMVDTGQFDGLLLSRLADFAALGVTSKTFPIFLTSNVVLGTPANCCTLGFHGSLANPFDGGLQTFAVASYDSTQHFPRNVDAATLSHEVGEWMDDPTAANPTPAWGHTGQVPGCQNTLEVGDPLTGTTMTVKMGNGIVYHPQEMAFFSWFYRNSTSLGINGWYSMNGTFKTPSAPCS